jgi:hypothetical protein
VGCGHDDVSRSRLRQLAGRPSPMSSPWLMPAGRVQGQRGGRHTLPIAAPSKVSPRPDRCQSTDQPRSKPAVEIHPAPRPRLPCSTMESSCVWVRVSEPPPGAQTCPPPGWTDSPGTPVKPSGRLRTRHAWCRASRGPSAGQTSPTPPGGNSVCGDVTSWSPSTDQPDN